MKRIYICFPLLNINIKDWGRIWTEYLAKYRLLSKIKDIKSMLVVGLPEEYGLGVDIIPYSLKGVNVTVIDPRKNKLKRFEEIVKNIHANVKTVLCEDLTKIPFKDSEFDIVINTEVIQAYEKSYKKIIKEMERVSKKHMFIFFPNSYCYAHPGISKLNSYKIKDITKIVSFKIVKKGYLDIPPWPAGINLESSNISFKGGSNAESKKINTIDSLHIESLFFFH